MPQSFFYSMDRLDAIAQAVYLSHDNLFSGDESPEVVDEPIHNLL